MCAEIQAKCKILNHNAQRHRMTGGYYGFKMPGRHYVFIMPDGHYDLITHVGH